jgi:hypothetical protein
MCTPNTECDNKRTSHANTRQNEQRIKTNMGQNELRVNGGDKPREGLKIQIKLKLKSSALTRQI